MEDVAVNIFRIVVWSFLGLFFLYLGYLGFTLLPEQCCPNTKFSKKLILSIGSILFGLIFIAYGFA